ncbi:MAG: DNA repair protein RecN [Geminicoccaceae bacterium]
MLAGLSIRDIVLIERLDLDFFEGLTVLTGETGAGKSILLDALGLAMGDRADRRLVRAGCEQGSVAATFAIAADHPLQAVLAERDIDGGEEIVIRRTLAADGRSRAFVNDQPVATALLRELAAQLLEIHGQMDQHGLLDARNHRALLDKAGGHQALVAATGEAHGRWKALANELARLRDRLEHSRREEEYLRHRLLELEDLAPRTGEEGELAAERQKLMAREKLLQLFAEAADLLSGSGGAIEKLGTAQRRLDRNADHARDTLQPAIDALERALIEAAEAEAQIEIRQQELEAGDVRLETVEERLFALRDMARKHRVAVDELPALLERTQAELADIDAGSASLCKLEKAVETERLALVGHAEALSRSRHEMALRLPEEIHRELPPLKLEKTRFEVRIDRLDEPTAEGFDRVGFEVSTNPGQPVGPLAKIASGGELSRLMLALKVVLGRGEDVRTLIFDEVDSGIGGATADAVGERLARLARGRQVIVVTHAPQVAARADHHLNVVKAARGQSTSVDVRRLEIDQRKDEIARMLAGAEITKAARAAAESLMAAGARNQ